MPNKAHFSDEIYERVNDLGEHGMDSALTIGLLTMSAYVSSARATE